MKKQESLDFLDNLIKETREMSQEEFDKRDRETIYIEDLAPVPREWTKSYYELYKEQREARLERPNRINKTPEELKEFNSKMQILIEKTTKIELDYLKENLCPEHTKTDYPENIEKDTVG